MANVYNLIISGDCNNTGSGAVSFGVTGGTPPYAITCINSTLPPTSALTGPYEYTAISLTADTYFLQITDAGSYSNIQSIYISSGTTASIDSVPTSCGLNNGSITGFTSGAYGNVKFTLYDGSDNYITSAQTPSPYYEFTSLSAGTYYIIADDGGGCTGITASVILTPSTGFTFGGYVVNNGSCIGGASGKVFITGLTQPTSAYTINWSTNVGSQTGFTVTGLTGGTYIATITDSQGCVGSQSFTITTVPPLASGGFIVISQPTCFANDGIVEFIIVDGTAPYFFSGSSGQVDVTFDTSVTFTGLSSGAYSFLVTDAGLCTIYDSVSLQTPNSFSSVMVNTTNATCSANDGTLQVIVDNGFSTESSLLISISGSTGISQVGSLGSSTQTFYGLANGTYIYTVSSLGCTYTGQTSINSSSLYSATTQVTGTTCGTNNGIVQVTASTGGTLPYTFTLTGPNYNPSTYTGPLSTFTNLPYGNYTLTIQDSSTPSCTQTYPVYVGYSQGVYFDLYPQNPITGNDGSITAFILSGEPEFDLTWSSNVGSQTGSTVTGLTAGTYSLTVVDTSGCSLTKSIILTGTKKYSSYRYYTVCEEQFFDSGLVTKRSMRAMYLEGFGDLTSGDTGCIINSADFSIYAQVGSQSAQTEFYISSGATDYPSDDLWANTIVSTLDSFDGISGVTYDIITNRINISSSCEEITDNCGTTTINPLQDNQIIVNLVIDYNISCVSCL
jgi:hypothetical protein